MGLEVVSQCLFTKFSVLLDEAEKDSGKLACISRFREAERLIKSKSNFSTVDLDIRDLLYELIQALSECRVFARRRRRRRGVDSSTSRFQFKPFLFVGQMNGRLDDVIKKIIEFQTPVEAKVVREIDFDDDNNDVDHMIIGFDSAAEKIKDLLVDANYVKKLRGIGIIGLCGSGKTALARKVFYSPEVASMFSPRIWVSLSDTFYDRELSSELREKILRYMLVRAGCDVSELATNYLGIAKLTEKLYHRLMGKRYLIVLDGVWHRNEWFADLGSELFRGNEFGDCISQALPKESGGRIILTSRREVVARQMIGGENLFHIDTLLSEQDCWSVFSDVVTRDGRIKLNHDTLVQMEKEISKNFVHLPLAARTLSEIISQQIYELQRH